jgi:ketosteroid isomerase-like protein
MSNINKEKGKEFLAAMFSGDAAGLSAVLADDFKMWFPKSAKAVANLPIPLVGREAAVTALIGTGDRVFVAGTVKWDVMCSFAEGDRSAIQLRLRGRTQTGHDYDNTYVFIFRIAADKVAEVWECTDTAHAQPLLFGKSAS